MVVGGITNEAVEAVIEQSQDSLRACQASPRTGRLLLHFLISADGTVRNLTLRSTTLRQPDTEDCVLKAVGELRFPQLTRGDRAVVTWPLTFP